MTDDLRSAVIEEDIPRQTEPSPAMPPPKIRLALYVTGHTQRSVEAIAAIRAICAEQLDGCVELEVIDLYQEPLRCPKESVIATPMVIKEMPEARRRLVGDLSDSARVLRGLELTTMA